MACKFDDTRSAHNIRHFKNPRGTFGSQDQKNDQAYEEVFVGTFFVRVIGYQREGIFGYSTFVEVH